jgi:hypothetical protein
MGGADLSVTASTMVGVAMTSAELGEIAVTSRCLGEYRDMFVLSEADLTAGPILDCPGGASSFGAQVRARGGDVVSVDPMYHASAAEILRRSAESRRRIHHYQSDHPDQFHWPYLGSPAANLRCAEVSADLFGIDFAANPGGYVPATLPQLPFPDRRFHLALSGYLLFTYADLLSFDEHVMALRELLRVSEEVRVFPLIDITGVQHPHLDALRSALEDDGVSVALRRAVAPQQPMPDADLLLVLQR